MIHKIKLELVNGRKSVCAVLGCGGGKSVIQGNIAKSATNKGNRVLFLVHRKELCEQITNTFRLCGVNFDLCDVSMVQTVTRRLSKLPAPQIIITDEAHHALSRTYIKIYEHFPSALKLGFTATPMRMNEGGLGKVFDGLVEGVSTTWLIENNYLAPYRAFSYTLADAKGLKVKRGDYDITQVNQMMEKAKIYGDTVKNWNKIAKDKKTIIYCSSIKASKATIDEFISKGIKAAHLDGETPKNLRRETIQKFRSGEITVLSNVDLFGEGFDVPDCECVVMLRPTKSLTLYIQQSMRSMRYQPNKTAIIIDHVGNIFEHGFPDDSREWSLKTKKKSKKSVVKVRVCDMCYACMPLKVRICPVCGHEIITQEQEEKERVEAELQEISKKDMLKRMKYDYYRKVKTFDEMKEFQEAKGYKFMWVIHKCLELKIDIPEKYSYMIRRFAR